MQIEIPQDILEKVTQASEILGVKDKDLIEKAIVSYLDNINKYSELNQEMQEGDSLSDEALVNFEKSI